MRQTGLEASIARKIGPRLEQFEIDVADLAVELAGLAAEGVMEAFGGELHHIPKKRDMTLEELKRQARDLRYRHGLTVGEIAERMSRSESTVRRYLAQ